jgi:hypothetical protein
MTRPCHPCFGPWPRHPDELRSCRARKDPPGSRIRTCPVRRGGYPSARDADAIRAPQREAPQTQHGLLLIPGRRPTRRMRLGGLLRRSVEFAHPAAFFPAMHLPYLDDSGSARSISFSGACPSSRPRCRPQEIVSGPRPDRSEGQMTRIAPSRRGPRSDQRPPAGGTARAASRRPTRCGPAGGLAAGGSLGT